MHSRQLRKQTYMEEPVALLKAVLGGESGYDNLAFFAVLKSALANTLL